MSYNGSGTWSTPAGQPVVSGSTISSTTHNTLVNDIATALSTCVLKDGQQTITANIPFNSNKITGLGAATQAGDATRLDQVQVIAPPSATDSATDAYQVNLGYGLATGDTFVADIDSANTTGTPTLENTGGAPAGAQSIVTTQGGAFAGMIEARPHRLQWDGTNYVILDPDNLDDTSVVGTLTAKAINSQSSSFSIPDDEVKTLTFDGDGQGMLILSGKNTGAGHAVAFFRVGATPQTALLASSLVDAGSVAVTTGALAGTTGTDTNLTISTHTDNKLYIENRTGGGQSYQVVLLAMQGSNVNTL